MIKLRNHTHKKNRIISKPKSKVLSSLLALLYLGAFSFFVALCLSAIFDIMPGEPAPIGVKVVAIIFIILASLFARLSAKRELQKLAEIEIYKTNNGLEIQYNYWMYQEILEFPKGKLDDVTYSYKSKHHPFGLVFLVKGDPIEVDTGLSKDTVNKTIKTIQKWIC